MSDLDRRLELAGAAFAELSTKHMLEENAPTCRIMVTANGDLLVHARDDSAQVLGVLLAQVAGGFVEYPLTATPADLDAYMGRGL